MTGRTANRRMSKKADKGLKTNARVDSFCGERQYLEITRGAAMLGAEILLRPNAWIDPYMGEPQDNMAVCSRFTAFANTCYLVGSVDGSCQHLC